MIHLMSNAQYTWSSSVCLFYMKPGRDDRWNTDYPWESAGSSQRFWGRRRGLEKSLKRIGVEKWEDGYILGCNTRQRTESWENRKESERVWGGTSTFLRGYFFIKSFQGERSEPQERGEEAASAWHRLHPLWPQANTLQQILVWSQMISHWKFLGL